MLPFPIVIYPQSYKDVAISYEMMTCATIIALLCLFVFVLSQQLFGILCPKRNRFVAQNTFRQNARQNKYVLVFWHDDRVGRCRSTSLLPACCCCLFMN